MTQRLLVIAIEQLQDGKLSKVRRNVMLDEYDRLTDEQKREGFVVLVEQLRAELDGGTKPVEVARHD